MHIVSAFNVSESIAEHLSMHKYFLSLNGLEKISDSSALILNKHPNKSLHLENLISNIKSK